MAKCLLVGDPHVTQDELDDCDGLVRCIKTAISYGPKFDYLVFLGDQFHNHSILNVHVLDWWKKTLIELRPLVNDNIICLVGNHDRPGNGIDSSINSMSTLDSLCLVVDDYLILDDMLFVGYQYDHNRFIDICQRNSDTKTVICHQTFDGAIYENGIYAKDGIDLGLLPAKQRFVSGHIHTPHGFGNVDYVGAPRWRNLNDANVTERYLYLLDSLPTEGSPFLDKLFMTNGFVHWKTILDFSPGTGPGNYSSYAGQNTIYRNFTGPMEWIEQTKSILKNQVIPNNVTFIDKFFQTDNKPISVRESEGIDISLDKYIDSLTLKTDRGVIKKMVEERIWKI